MPAAKHVRFREAGVADAMAVGRLHADSWRRHYRGAYSDAFLDGDVEADRLSTWSRRLADAGGANLTILAETDHGLAGFVHVIFEEDPMWGSLLDNVHVAAARQRKGIGTRLMAQAAEAVIERPHAEGLYLWVLEQNRAAQAFYEARGGRCVETERVTAPGGLPGRLQGSPLKRRYVWTDPAGLLPLRA
jgi:ribosomal protein S18 acetylase RimI-like enzyme